MKRMFLLLGKLLLAIFICQAQNTNTKGKISPFLLDKFEEAEVFFHDGSRYQETINYNLLTNRFYFIDKTDQSVKAVSNPQDIFMVKTKGRCFYQEKGYAIEVVPTHPPLFVQYKAHIRKEADKGAYGTTSETSSIRTYGGFGANGNRFDLNTEELFIGKEGFEVCETEGNYGYPMVICSGECNRAERPLACRIFPLFPLVYEEDGKLNFEVVYDPRANMCPLAAKKEPLDPSFIKEVRKTARYLAKDKEILEYMLKVSEEILEIIELHNILLG